MTDAQRESLKHCVGSALILGVVFAWLVTRWP